MHTSQNRIRSLAAVCALLIISTVALAADPGSPYPPASQVSDQKAGSLLIYNTYTSSASAPAQENTRINITNTNPTLPAFVHFFFVEGTTCSVADTFICFTQNQTASFITSDADPGTRGYLVALAVDLDGEPTAFNFLTGDEYVKYASGHAANLGAEAFAKRPEAPGVGSSDGTTYTLVFDFGQDGVTVGSYNRVARVLADDSIPSRLDGNDTKLIVNRIGGSLVSGASTLGTLFAVIYDDAENTFSTSFSGPCHLEFSIGASNLPRVVGGWNALIPAGHTGWTKFWKVNADQFGDGILGAAINFNAGTAGFNGGHNLHKLTLSPFNAYIVPVFPPSC
jgi:hypothetical protein